MKMGAHFQRQSAKVRLAGAARVIIAIKPFQEPAAAIYIGQNRRLFQSGSTQFPLETREFCAEFVNRVTLLLQGGLPRACGNNGNVS